MSEARQTVWALFGVGVVLGMVGSFMAVTMWRSGDVWPSVVATLASSLGWLLAFVSVVAWGVRLGMESAARRG